MKTSIERTDCAEAVTPEFFVREKFFPWEN